MRVGYKHRDLSSTLKSLTILSLSIVGAGKHRTTFSTISTGRLKRRKWGLVAVRIRRCSGSADVSYLTVGELGELIARKHNREPKAQKALGLDSLNRPEVSFWFWSFGLEANQVRTLVCLAITWILTDVARTPPSVKSNVEMSQSA